MKTWARSMGTGRVSQRLDVIIPCPFHRVTICWATSRPNPPRAHNPTATKCWANFPHKKPNREREREVDGGCQMAQVTWLTWCGWWGANWSDKKRPALIRSCRTGLASSLIIIIVILHFRSAASCATAVCSIETFGGPAFSCPAFRPQPGTFQNVPKIGSFGSRCRRSPICPARVVSGCDVYKFSSTAKVRRTAGWKQLLGLTTGWWPTEITDTFKSASCARPVQVGRPNRHLLRLPTTSATITGH